MGSHRHHHQQLPQAFPRALPHRLQILQMKFWSAAAKCVILLPFHGMLSLLDTADERVEKGTFSSIVIYKIVVVIVNTFCVCHR